MPTFKELSSQETLPVIYSQRRDGTVLTAIKVPIDDVRLDRWGWVLSLSHKDGSSNQDDIATLQDNNKQRYPKIYTADEVSNYNEKHAYDSWEVGYNGQLNKIQSRRITAPLNTDMLQKEMLQETLENIYNSQDEFTQRLNGEFILQNQMLSDGVYKQFFPSIAKIAEMRDQIHLINEGVADAIEKNTETKEKILEANTQQREILVEGMEKIIEQMPILIYKEIKADFNASLRNIDEQLDAMDGELKEQLEQVQLETSKTVQKCFTPLIGDARNQLEELNQNLKEQAIQTRDLLVKEIENSVEDSNYILTEMDKSLKEQTTQNHIELISEIKDHNLNVENITQEQFREIKSSLKENIDRQDEGLKELREQIKKLLELTDLEDPGLKVEDLKISDKDDLVTIATKNAKKPTTRIIQMANGQLRISSKYYDNVNEQSKRSFQMALRLSAVGGVIFILTIVIVIVTEALHIQKDPSLLPIGTVISALTEFLAGLNFVYNRASKQFMAFQVFLDRIIRASISQAIAEEIKDEEYKQKVLERIVENLLKLKEDDKVESDDKNHKNPK